MLSSQEVLVQHPKATHGARQHLLQLSREKEMEEDQPH